MEAHQDRSLRWLIRRLSRVGPAEALHRLRGQLWWAAAGKRPTPDALQDVGGPWLAVPSLTDPQRDSLTRRADRVLQGDLPGFGGLWWAFDGDWNRDPRSGRRFPVVRGDRVPYRDPGEHGDIRALWEVQRHHHLAWLAQAWASTERTVYLDGLGEQLRAFLDQCPFPCGSAWTSALESAVRLANWSVAWQLAAEALPADLRDRWRRAALQALELVRANRSEGSSSNNHLVGELGGLVVGGVTWEPSRVAADLDRLGAQLLRQIAPDGSSREGSPGYLGFVVTWGLIAGAAGATLRTSFSSAAWARLAAAGAYLRATAAGGDVPALGDADDGQVLQLGSRRLDPARVGRLTLAVLSEDSDDDDEACWWASGCPVTPSPSARTWFEDAGEAWLRGEGPFRVLLRGGQIGEGALGGHGHLDALSVLAWVAGEPLLVDRGTGSYLAAPEWRAHFRGSSAHSTVTIDGRGSSEASGAFQWGRRARVEVRTMDGGGVVGRHDGFEGLKDPVTHERRVFLDGDSLTVDDTFRCRGEHEVTLYWQVAPGWEVTVDGAGARADKAGIACVLEATSALSLHIGEVATERLGWHSVRFGEWQAAPTLRQVVAISGTTSVRTTWRTMVGG